MRNMFGVLWKGIAVVIHVKGRFFLCFFYLFYFIFLAQERSCLFFKFCSFTFYYNNKLMVCCPWQFLESHV